MPSSVSVTDVATSFLPSLFITVIGLFFNKVPRTYFVTEILPPLHRYFKEGNRIYVLMFLMCILSFSAISSASKPFFVIPFLPQIKTPQNMKHLMNQLDKL